MPEKNGRYSCLFLIAPGLALQVANRRALYRPLVLLAWRNWQTRTAQDRMGKPVEVRVLSRAVISLSLRANLLQSYPSRSGRSGYFRPDALRRAAQRAFINCESLLRPAAVSPPFFVEAGAFVPPDFRLAAQRAFISSDSLFRPAGVSAPFFLVEVDLAARGPPFSLAQRALAAAESFARVDGEKYRPA